MNKKELAKLVYNHPIVKNLYKSSDKTVINKLIAEEVLKEADGGRLKQLQKDLNFFQEEIEALENAFPQAKNKKEAREIQAEITEFLGVIADLEKKISVLQKIEQPPEEAVQAVEAIVADGKRNIEATKATVKSLDKAKLKAFVDKFKQYDQKLSVLTRSVIQQLQQKKGNKVSLGDPNASQEQSAAPQQAGKGPSLNVKNPAVSSNEMTPEEAKAALETLKKSEKTKIAGFIEWASEKLKQKNLQEQIYSQIVQILNEADTDTNVNQSEQNKTISIVDVEQLFLQYAKEKKTKDGKILSSQQQTNLIKGLQKHSPMIRALLNQAVHGGDTMEPSQSEEENDDEIIKQFSKQLEDNLNQNATKENFDESFGTILGNILSTFVRSMEKPSREIYHKLYEYSVNQKDNFKEKFLSQIKDAPQTPTDDAQSPESTQETQPSQEPAPTDTPPAEDSNGEDIEQAETSEEPATSDTSSDEAGKEEDAQETEPTEEPATLDQAKKDLISKATTFNTQLPEELKGLPFINDVVFKIWLGSKIDKAGVMKEQEEQVDFSTEDVQEGILTTEEVKQLNDILTQNKEQISKIIKFIPSYSGPRATSKSQQQLTKIDTPTTKDALATTEPGAEEQIASTEEAKVQTEEAAQEDAKVQKPVQIEEFSPIMNYMNDFFLEPSNPQVAGFMENILLKYQSRQLYKFIAHLDTILSPEFQQAFTDSSNAEKPTPPEEEPTSATPTPAPAEATPEKATVQEALGNLFGSKKKEEQATVQIPKKNRAALREELLTLVDLLKYLKLVVSNYEKNSTKTSIFNSYKGSSMKKVMDDLMNQVQSNLSYIMNEIQNARTAAATEQSTDMQATAAASNANELAENIYEQIVNILNEQEGNDKDVERKTSVELVKSVYEKMRALYKTAMKTNLEALIKGGSAQELDKLINNAKEMKGFATDPKFISLFPTGQLVSGNVVTISDGLKALEQSIEGFIGLARDVATFVKSGESLPSTQLTEAEYKIVDLATAIQENFGVNSKIDQSIMTKIKAGLKEEPGQTPLTDTPSEEKEQQSTQAVSSSEAEAQPEVTPSPEETTDTSTEVPQQEISPSDAEIKRSLSKMKFESKSLQFYLKPIKEVLEPIFGEKQQALQNKFLGLLFLQFHPELLGQEQIKEVEQKENEGSFKSRITYFYPRIIKTASKILTPEEAQFIKENQQEIIKALTTNEALIGGKIEDTSPNSIYSFLSKQLGKKEENLEEKLKPIIEKMLRQHYR